MVMRKWGFLSLLLLVLSIPIIPAQAQNQDVILTLAVPDFFREFFEDQIVAEFEAAHPSIQLYIVSSGGFGTPLNAASDVDEYLDAVDDYVTTADVVIVDSNIVPEATRAGYFLDLSPLVNSDPTLNSADFYTALWDSFQWDGGMWALPVAGDAVLLFYDPAAFDAAGLAYPDETWNIDDLDFAVRSLTQFDPSGAVTSPGLLNFADLGTVIVSLLGQGVYDDSLVPALPRFDNPELETILTTWAAMETDGLFTLPDEISPGFEDVPMLISGTTLALIGGPNQAPREAAVLPGGRGGLTATGLGISSGTQYPEDAYALVRFLVTNPLVGNSFFGSRPANRNIEFGGGGAGIVFGGGNGGGGGQRGGLGGNNALSDQTETLIQATLDNGIPISETRFADWFNAVIVDMAANNIDARTALQTVEADIVTRLDVASARRATVQVVVDAPILAPELAPGEVVINFGLGAIATPSPDMDRWQSAAQDFAASDPEVGFVSLGSTLQNASVTEMAGQYDCFFTPSNSVPTVDLDVLRSIDPLIASDPAFNGDDFVGNSLALVTRNNQIWAFPLSIQPVAMRYDPAQFANAGVFEPFVGWSVSDFETALRSFALNPDGTPPFVPGGFGSSNLLLLMAAYGGLPIDYRTDPPTLNFTDPTTVEAIRQVLNLARDGYMEYNALTGGGGFVVVIDGETPALAIEAVSGFGGIFIGGGGDGSGGGGNFTGGFTPNAGSDDTRLTTFPRGTQYVPLSYQLGVGYISADTQVVEACYRFLSFVSQRADLYQSMPARRSMINHPDVAAAQGEDRVAFYQAMDESMQQPNAIIIESIAPGAGRGNLIATLLETYWLTRAFDRYVLEDADLETELSEAELFTRAFMECAANIAPAPGDGGGPGGGFANQFLACVTQVDPTAQLFGN